VHLCLTLFFTPGGANYVPFGFDFHNGWRKFSLLLLLLLLGRLFLLLLVRRVVGALPLAFVLGLAALINVSSSAPR